MHEHVTDVFVQRSKAEGFRSRAAYKLMEIDDRDRLIRPGETVVDLGAAPGGWSQVVANRLGGRGRIIALDLLEMSPIHGVDFIQGDFREDVVLHQLEELLSGGRVGLVLSDMAPNISGIPISDQARVMHLAELGVDFSKQWLKESLENSNQPKNIVVTHHAPSINSVPEIYKNDPITSAYASSMESFIEEHQPDYWIHGHIHTPVRYHIGKTEIICNPVGYIDEVYNGYEKELIIEL